MRSARIFDTRFGELVEPKVKNSITPDSDTKFEKVPETSSGESFSRPSSVSALRGTSASRTWTQVSAEFTSSIEEVYLSLCV